MSTKIKYTKEEIELEARLSEAANEEGTIQAGDMLRLAPGRPELHTTMSVSAAFTALTALRLTEVFCDEKPVEVAWLKRLATSSTKLDGAPAAYWSWRQEDPSYFDSTLAIRAAVEKVRLMISSGEYDPSDRFRPQFREVAE